MAAMVRSGFSSAKAWLATGLALGALLICIAAPFCSAAAQQTAPPVTPDVAPDATPQIQQIDPTQAVPGAHLTVVIQGNNFAAGAVASSASTAIHIDSSKRVSATRLELQLSVSESAQPGSATLLVSNPASSAAESAFSIVAAQAAPAPAAPAQNSEPAKPANPTPSTEPAAPATPQTPAAPPSAPPTPEGNPATPQAPAAPPANPAAPSAQSTPETPLAPAAPAEVPAPEVTTVTPPKVGQGFDIDLKLIGKNFVPGTKVSFANQGIRVIGIPSSSPTELTVHIKVAGDATPGKTSVFVINPDDNEAEAPIEVALKGTFTSTPYAPASPGSPPGPDTGYTQHFDAFHLGNPTEIFHVHGKVKGSLVVSSDAVKYEEDKKTLINISLSEIQEVKTAGIGGVNIKLNSGKTHHFAAASLKGSDARTIVEAIQKAMPTPSAN
jgi:hypothetical protein